MVFGFSTKREKVKYPVRNTSVYSLTEKSRICEYTNLHFHFGLVQQLHTRCLLPPKSPFSGPCALHLPTLTPFACSRGGAATLSVIPNQFALSGSGL